MSTILNEIILSAQNAEVHVSKDSWYGDIGASGLGILIIFFTWYINRSGNKKVNVRVKPGAWLAGKIDTIFERREARAKEKAAERGEEYREPFPIDWRSTLCALAGFFGITALLGSDSWASDRIVWVQEWAAGWESVGFFSSIGMGGICFIACFFTIRAIYGDKYDGQKDLMWGGVLAILFPLAGGTFLSISNSAADALSGLFGG
ncbi:hypothetical protein [Rhodococcus qingshengii]|uniref:hypothetical protein n=1 Tax=Rhodococcus qingshengii TaxID=334542 RepID=UPI0035DAABFF